MMRVLCVVLLLMPGACGSAPNAQAPAAPAPEFIQARAAILDLLRDPASAKFGPMARGRAGAVCGTVNARNGFGGYTGGEAFAWSAAAGGLLYDFQGELGGWRERGELARRFAALGCSVGPDQAKAIAAVDALEASDRRLEAATS